MLIWKAHYTTGVPELDEQHQRIFALLNELGEMIDRGRYDCPEVDALLEAFGSDMRSHFHQEEGCMLRYGCPMAQKNKEEHDEILRLYEGFISGFGEEKTLSTLSGFHSAASDWMLEHFCFVDIHMRSCVRNGRGG